MKWLKKSDANQGTKAQRENRPTNTDIQIIWFSKTEDRVNRFHLSFPLSKMVVFKTLCPFDFKYVQKSNYAENFQQC